jgi:hypothetical protein
MATCYLVGLAFCLCTLLGADGAANSSLQGNEPLQLAGGYPIQGAGAGVDGLVGSGGSGGGGWGGPDDHGLNPPPDAWGLGEGAQRRRPGLPAGV